MLSRRNAVQAPRCFRAESGGGGGATSSNAPQSICIHCSERIFNATFHERLLTAWERRLDCEEIEYTQPASELYRSIQQGCPWCTSIGNAILTSIESDYWHNHFAGDGDDDSSESGSETPVIEKEGQEDEGDDDAALHESDFGDKVAIGEALAASIAAEEVEHDHADDDELARLVEAVLTVDLLNCDAELRTKVSFERDAKRGVFDWMRSSTQVTRLSEDSLLPTMDGDTAVEMSFEVISPGLPMFPSEWGAISAASNEWISTAKIWLDDCRSSHPTCNNGGGGKLPSRLIHIGLSNEIQLVAVSSHVIGKYPYAALSYVWRGNQHYVLTNDTLNEKVNSLDMNQIPQSIKDAIHVTRSLGLSYLWVDSLCIIQDSAEDKKTELRKMRDIYKCSAVTIMASSTSQSTDSFLVPPEAPEFTVAPFDIPFNLGGENPSSAITLAYRSFDQTSNDPINKRGWTLQERILSTRVLSFSSRGVMWSCDSSDINPCKCRKAPPAFAKFRAIKALSDLAFVSNSSMADLWLSVRAEYAKRHLTYPCDRLPAISALAAEVATKTRWTYLAGLWKENLFSELHWHVVKDDSGFIGVDSPQMGAEMQYVAPSWSWASVGCAADVRDSEYNRGIRTSHGGFHIVSDEVKLEDDAFPFGRLSFASLKAEGRTLDLLWRPCDDLNADVALVAKTADDDQGIVVGEGLKDREDWGVKVDTITCLAVSIVDTGKESTSAVEGLLLVPAEGGAMRRVGFFRSHRLSLFDNAIPKVLDLV